MSRFLSRAASALKPYTPGEQPRDNRYIKLNTNENPYPPAPAVAEAIAAFAPDSLRLYPDPTATEFREAVAKSCGLTPDMVFVGGGSDEVLGYAFMAFFDRGDKVYFPDITYGFYRVYADLFGLESVEVPLREDFTVSPEDYFGLPGNIFIANPNAPTGICLAVSDIEEILRRNPERLVVVDEAYTAFSDGKTCLPLLQKYDNLLIVRTFSKSHGLAGMRLGLGLGNPGLTAGLERVKYSFNPYNLDRVSLAAGIAAAGEDAYTNEITGKIIKTRERVSRELNKLGFEVLRSEANFLFAKSDRLNGGELYEKLKENGILVRYFDIERIRGFVRITIGTDEEMDIFLRKLEELL